MAESHPMPLVDEIEMGVELHDVDRRLVSVGIDAGNVDRVIAAEDDRQRPSRENLAYAEFDVGMAGEGISMDHVGIADVDDPDALEIGVVVLVIVGTGMAEGK